MQVAVRADIDGHIVGIEAAAEARQNLVAAACASRAPRRSPRRAGGRSSRRPFRTARGTDGPSPGRAASPRYPPARARAAAGPRAQAWPRPRAAAGSARPKASDPARERRRVSSASAWRASVGASGSPAAFGSQRQSGSRGAGLRDLVAPTRATRRIRRPSGGGSASPACECWSPGRRWSARPRTAGSAPRRRRAPRGCAGTRRASCRRAAAGARPGSRRPARFTSA